MPFTICINNLRRKKVLKDVLKFISSVLTVWCQSFSVSSRKASDKHQSAFKQLVPGLNSLNVE